jgi:stearoyl-CoA desaturase (Delta-9 desaturase)
MTCEGRGGDPDRRWCRAAVSTAQNASSPVPRTRSTRAPRRIGWYFNVGGIAAIHVTAVWAIARGVTLELALLAATTYLVRMFAVTGVYHRYFSHRSYKTSRAMQLVLAFLGTTAAQKGPLWWASCHRAHHKDSDTERDIHSPLRKGFWYSHMGWWLGREHEAGRPDLIPDFAGYPELRWLERHAYVGPLFLIAVVTLAFGLDGFLWGFAVSTCALMHGTFTINSLSHVFGSRRYATTDTSRNNFLLALITLGEGWHNNHHHYMSSANQGFMWWEIDISYYVICLLEKVGLVWDVRRPTAIALRKNLLAEVGERAPLLLAQQEPRPLVPARADTSR